MHNCLFILGLVGINLLMYGAEVLSSISCECMPLGYAREGESRVA